MKKILKPGTVLTGHMSAPGQPQWRLCCVEGESGLQGQGEETGEKAKKQILCIHSMNYLLFLFLNRVLMTS